MDKKTMADFEALLRARGLDPKKVERDVTDLVRAMFLIMLSVDHRIAMTAAFIALACFVTQRTPDELTEEFSVVYQEVLDRLMPLKITRAEADLRNAPLASTKVN